MRAAHRKFFAQRPQADQKMWSWKWTPMAMAPAVGPRFIVELPIETARSPAAAVPPDLDESDALTEAPPARILVIDDEQRFAASLRSALGTRHTLTAKPFALAEIERVLLALRKPRG